MELVWIILAICFAAMVVHALFGRMFEELRNERGARRMQRRWKDHRGPRS